MVIELCLLFIILPIENCIRMTRNALSIEAVGRRANNVLLTHSIQAWYNDCWSNKVIEEQLDQIQILPPQRGTVLHGLLAWPHHRYIPPSTLDMNSHQRYIHVPRGTLNSSARVACRAHG